MKQKKKILLTGGGTAGHVYPALAVAEKLNDCELHYIGSNGIEKEILKNYPHIAYHEISAVKLERKLTLRNLLIPFKLYSAVKSAKRLLKQLAPDVIFSKGGFVAVPVAMASKKMHIPLISHESDLSLGLANKIILHYCDKMCTTFEETSKQNAKCVFTGQPIRQKIFSGTKKSFGFNNSKPILLVLGGSLGAKFLNDIIFENLDTLTNSFNILHICGKNNFKQISHKNYKCVAYAEDIQNFYASADLVLARAGSGVINELLALEKPMLLIPLSKKCSRGDQIENAKLFTKLGYSQMLEEEDYTLQKLQEKLEFLNQNRKHIKENMRSSTKTNASEKIANMILKK